MVRLGLLSTARINLQVLRACASSGVAEVVAVASRDTGRAHEYARAHGIARAHGSYDELLADPVIDAVYVSLPNALHHAWTLAALAAGKHVLCEKPYSRRPDDVEEAFDLAEREGLVLTEAFMYRHHPQLRLVQDLLADGVVGRVRSIRAVFRFQLENAADVRMSRELGGGSLMDVGCYCVSGARLVAGEPIRALGEQVVAEAGVDVAFHGTLRFPDDVVAQIDASFLAPRGQELEVVGEEGALVVEAPWRADWGGGIVARRDDGVERIEPPPGDSYALELEDFVAAIEGRGAPLLGREDALGQARAIDALYRAAESGASVAL